MTEAREVKTQIRFAEVKLPYTIQPQGGTWVKTTEVLKTEQTNPDVEQHIQAKA